MKIATIIIGIITIILLIFGRVYSQSDLDIGPHQITPLESEGSVQVYLSDKIDIFIDSTTWCFDRSQCNNQSNVDFIGKIIMTYGWDADNYGIACVPLYNDDTTPYLHLRIVMLSKINPNKRYLHVWEMEEKGDGV